MTATTLWPRIGERRGVRALASLLAWGLGAGGTGAVAAYLLAGGHWYLVVAGILAIPAFVVLHRFPMAGVLVWMATVPLVVRTSGQGARYLFWLTHRTLPVVVLVLIIVSTALGVRARRLPKLGWPEVAMAGYAVASLLSIAYMSPDASAAAILLYDRVLVPMALYTIVRLLQPGEAGLRRIALVAVLVLVVQSAIGGIAWFAPDALPSAWTGRAGERTTGSLGNPNAFGTTVLFAGMLALHTSAALRRLGHGARRALQLAFLLAAVMAFFTLNRATWTAGSLALIGLLALYPRLIARMSLLVVPLLVAALVGGVLDTPTELAEQRFLSEQSKGTALSRLPVVMASLRMFEERPLTGWGYENFNLHKRQFERRVGEIVNPETDHSSHNLYLTILAEQGVIGVTLFLFPAVWWLVRSRGAMQRLPREGLASQKSLIILWLSLGTHVIVNNFTSVQVPFSTGLWWITLGLIGSMVCHDPSNHPSEAPPRTVGQPAFVPRGVGA